MKRDLYLFVFSAIFFVFKFLENGEPQAHPLRQIKEAAARGGFFSLDGAKFDGLATTDF